MQQLVDLFRIKLGQIQAYPQLAVLFQTNPEHEVKQQNFVDCTVVSAISFSAALLLRSEHTPISTRGLSGATLSRLICVQVAAQLFSHSISQPPYVGAVI